MSVVYNVVSAHQAQNVYVYTSPGMLKNCSNTDSMYLAQLQKSFPGFVPNAGIYNNNNNTHTVEYFATFIEFVMSVSVQFL